MYSLLIFVLSIIAVSADPCGEGWRYFPGTNNCYKKLNDILPWTVAEFKCLFQGGHHVSIDSYEENQFVKEVAQYAEIWTGAAFFGKNPVYVYSDQTPYKFENWQKGKTPSMNRARRCIKMDRNGTWFQSCCKRKTYAVCEKAAAYVPSWESTNSSSDFRRLRFARRRM